LLSLIHVLEWRAAVHPGAIALSDQQGAKLTYVGLAAAVDRSAAGFAAADSMASAGSTAAGDPPPRPVDRLRPAEPAILVHTSGTTGRPKLVPLTHQQLIIGIPDERWGETVHAVVVLALGDTARANGDAEPGFDADALVSWARERLAGFKCPTGVTVVAELPRNATGKVLRAALRQPFWAGRDRLVS
jgi:acyl-CoA synthetase (AMP-forming)/AMP-acid ligase II